MSNWAKIPLEIYDDINRATQRVLGQPENTTAPGPKRTTDTQLRYARVITCSLASGYGTIQFCSGNRASLTPDTSLTVKCGMSSIYRTGHDVVVSQVAAEDYAWEVVAFVRGPTLYKDPETDGSILADIQDEPDPEAYCEDTVNVP